MELLWNRFAGFARPDPLDEEAEPPHPLTLEAKSRDLEKDMQVMCSAILD